VGQLEQHHTVNLPVPKRIRGGPLQNCGGLFVTW